jgi:hypothetical protein
MTITPEQIESLKAGDRIVVELEEGDVSRLNDYKELWIMPKQIIEIIPSPTIPEGFTPWAGGENPCPGKQVEAIYRDDRTDRQESDWLDWHIPQRGCSHKIGSDIIAYRVIEPEKKEWEKFFEDFISLKTIDGGYVSIKTLYKMFRDRMRDEA